MKVSDEFTVPLCRSHHRNLHQAGNEVRWWENFRIEPLPVACKLWEETHSQQRRVSQASVVSQPTAAATSTENYETQPIGVRSS